MVVVVVAVVVVVVWFEGRLQEKGEWIWRMQGVRGLPLMIVDGSVARSLQAF